MLATKALELKWSTIRSLFSSAGCFSSVCLSQPVVSPLLPIARWGGIKVSHPWRFNLLPRLETPWWRFYRKRGKTRKWLNHIFLVLLFSLSNLKWAKGHTGACFDPVYCSHDQRNIYTETSSKLVKCVGVAIDTMAMVTMASSIIISIRVQVLIYSIMVATTDLSLFNWIRNCRLDRKCD